MPERYSGEKTGQRPGRKEQSNNNSERYQMKKQLLGTTALVAAGLFAMADVSPAQAQQKVEPVKITVNGYMGQFFTIIGQDDVGSTSSGRSGKFSTFDNHSDQEIHFNGRTTLDNGITIGLRIEFEGMSATDVVDESYMFIESKFGRIEAGQINNVHYRMAYKAPDVFTRGWVNEGNVSNVLFNPVPRSSFNSDSMLGTTVSRFRDNDSDKINYYTPRFEGFQFGVSYMPDSSQDTASPVPTSSAYTRGWAVAGNFVRTFGQFDIAAYAGYMTWQGPQTSATASAPDPDQYSLGLQLGYAGFRVGGSYGKLKDGRLGGAGTDGASAAGTLGTLSEGDAWDIGASYTFGPASVSLTYMDGNNESASCSLSTQVCSSSTIKDKFTMLSLAGKYVLGPGISLEAALFTAKIKPGDSTPENSATGFIGGVLIIF